MKRFLTTAVLTLALLLALTACGGETEQPPADDVDPTVSDNQDDDRTQEPAATGVDLAALRDELIDSYNVTEAISVDGADTLERLYGIDPGVIVSAAGFTATSDGAFPLEVMLVETANKDAADGVEAKLQDRLDTIAEQAAAYDPESQALAEAAPVVKEGTYVAMFFIPDYDGMAGDFRSAVS